MENNKKKIIYVLKYSFLIFSIIAICASATIYIDNIKLQASQENNRLLLIIMEKLDTIQARIDQKFTKIEDRLRNVEHQCYK